MASSGGGAAGTRNRTRRPSYDLRFAGQGITDVSYARDGAGSAVLLKRTGHRGEALKSAGSLVPGRISAWLSVVREGCCRSIALIRREFDTAPGSTAHVAQARVADPYPLTHFSPAPVGPPVGVGSLRVVGPAGVRRTGQDNPADRAGPKVSLGGVSRRQATQRSPYWRLVGHAHGIGHKREGLDGGFTADGRATLPTVEWFARDGVDAPRACRRRSPQEFQVRRAASCCAVPSRRPPSCGRSGSPRCRSVG